MKARPLISIILIAAAIFGATTAILSNMIALDLQEIGVFNFHVIINCLENAPICLVNGQQVTFEPGLRDRAEGFVVLSDDHPDEEAEENDEESDEESSERHNDIPEKTQVRLFDEEELDHEGCPPSYWISGANPEPNSMSSGWPIGYLPDQKFGSPSYFNNAIVISSGKDPTLLESLNSEGDGINKLARQSVAALLNAAHPDIDYPLTIMEVISLTQSAIAQQNYEIAEKFSVYNNLGEDTLCKSNLPDPSDLD
jgi:hypothetical protein